MSYSDYGIKGKGKTEGKGKDKSQGKKSSGKGWGNSRKGEIFERLDQEGKGNKSSRSKLHQPYIKKEHVQDYYDSWENDSGGCKPAPLTRGHGTTAKAGVQQLPRVKARIGATRSPTLIFFLVVNVWLLQVQINHVIFAR